MASRANVVVGVDVNAGVDVFVIADAVADVFVVG